jgi:hypothetical protein
MCSLWIVNYKHKFTIAINFFFILLAVFIFILNKLAFKWYKVPTMLLEKVSIHTEILFVHCYKFFIITCSFSVFVENCILLPMRYKWICCVPVYCTCMVLIFYPFTQIFIISHKGTIFPQNWCIYRYTSVDPDVSENLFVSIPIYFPSEINQK